MTQATLTLVDGMQFMAHTGTGHAFAVDGAPEVGGKNSGPRPMELMAAGVAACTAMDVISILRKSKQKVTELKVHVNGERASEHPKKFETLHIEYTIVGYDVSEDRVARAIELSENKYCSAIASLRPGVEIKTSYKILEASQELMLK
jgi:putative redox protein